MAYGTDLLGRMHARQLDEFHLRAEAVPPADLLLAATVNAARLVRRESKIGLIAPGFRADLIVLDGNPLEDIGVVADAANPPRLVMKEGGILVERDWEPRPPPGSGGGAFSDRAPHAPIPRPCRDRGRGSRTEPGRRGP